VTLNRSAVPNLREGPEAGCREAMQFMDLPRMPRAAISGTQSAKSESVGARPARPGSRTQDCTMPMLVLLGKLLDLVNNVIRPAPVPRPIPIRTKDRRQR